MKCRKMKYQAIKGERNIRVGKEKIKRLKGGEVESWWGVL